MRKKIGLIDLFQTLSLSRKRIFKLKNACLLFFFVLCSGAIAQNKYIDSVKTLTSSKVDTIRFWAYSELIWELKDKDKASALKYGNDLLSEAKKIG
ncbi:MAG: hypothetical protein QM734_17095 [Cyclobacteriaceae bacterium]